MRLFLFILLFFNTLYADLSFLGLIDGKWQIALLKDKKVELIKTELEPHSFDYSFKYKRLVYIASDETLRVVEDGEEIVVLKKDKDSYIQPKLSKDAKMVYVVKLIDGTSKNSDIIEINIETKEIKNVVNQRSTQLEPYMRDNKNLYYTNVICTVGCREIISEIWHKNIVSGRAKQLTLTNVVSQQPTIDDNKNIYFSSNQDNNFHIWKYNLEKKEYKELTKGEVNDGFPLFADGKLYFIRQIDGSSRLMVMDKNITEVVLPKNIKKIRYLRGR